MTDRDVQWPNRFRVSKVPGTDDIFDITPVPGDVYADGDLLNKLTLCADDLCIALGLPTTATPTQAMDKLRQLVNTAQTGVDNGVKIATGSYAGTGESGPDNPNSLTFSFPPKVIFMLGMVGSDQWMELTGTGDRFILSTDVITTSYKNYRGFLYNGSSEWAKSFCKKDSTGKTISWYNTMSSSAGPQRQCNESGYTYYYLAIG